MDWNWDFSFADTATFMAVGKAEDATKYRSVTFSTGEPPNATARWHTLRDMHTLAVEIGVLDGDDGAFLALYIPDAIRRTQENHLRTWMRRAYGRIITDAQAIVTHCQATADSVTFDTSAGTVKFTHGNETLTFRGWTPEFREAMDVARINSKVKVLKSHFITPDNVAAFDAHVAALEAKHRGQACAMASGILAELATHFADWTV